MSWTAFGKVNNNFTSNIPNALQIKPIELRHEFSGKKNVFKD